MSLRADVPIAVRLHGKGASAGAGRTDGADGGEVALPPAVKVVVYRVAQEALMNAAKYANARTISVQLRTRGAGKGKGMGNGQGRRGTGTQGTGRTIELEIADDGRGFDPEAVPAGHFGLGIMRERARAVGASVQVRSHVGQGTVVRMMWRGGRSEMPE
jgi:signal transduction histidine kinase